MVNTTVYYSAEIWMCDPYNWAKIPGVMIKELYSGSKTEPTIYPCRFQYNNVWYGGLRIQTGNYSIRMKITGNTFGNHNVNYPNLYKSIEYKNATTVINQEVYNTLNYIQGTGWDYIFRNFYEKLNNIDTMNHEYQSIQFYHNTDAKYAVFKTSIPYNVTSMVTMQIIANTYGEHIGVDITATFYIYSSSIYNFDIVSQSNIYTLQDNIFLVKMKNTGDIALVINKDYIAPGRVYLSGVCSIASVRSLMFDRLKFDQIADATALNEVIDTTWASSVSGGTGMVSPGNIKYSVLTYNQGPLPFKTTNTSFSDLISGNLGTALDDIKTNLSSYEKGIRFLTLTQYDYEGIFIKHNESCFDWYWLGSGTAAANTYHRRIQKYTYNGYNSKPYSVATFMV